MRRLVPVLLVALGCQAPPAATDDAPVATFAAGCYWCVEAAFERVPGVVDVRSGFMGGAAIDATDGGALIEAGHAEVVQVRWDPAETTYEELLEWFWRVHDPTSVDRQGEDEGPEYRSEIFVHSDEQRAAAAASRERARLRHDRPIVTAISDASRFHPAAEEQQDYYARNRESRHCRLVIAPHLRSVGLPE